MLVPAVISKAYNCYATRVILKASSGGALFLTDSSFVLFRGSTRVAVNDNKVGENGGAIYSTKNSAIVSKDNSMVIFSTNSAMTGGAVFSDKNGYIIVAGNSTVTFLNNSASSSGALHSHLSNISFVDNSMTTFIGNTVTQNGAAVYCFSAHIRLYSTINFMSNRATQSGGAIWSSGGSHISFNQKSSFIKNKAANGGAIFISDSSITFEENLIVFDANIAVQNGGAIHSTDSSIIYFKENRSLLFINNKAGNGGAVSISDSSVTFGTHSIFFDNNTALHRGGALYLSDNYNITFDNNSNVTFSNNNVDGYGGAIYAILAKATTYFTFNGYSHFRNNYARAAGNSLYIIVTKSCDSSCLNDSILSTSKTNWQISQFSKEIAVTPNNIKLYHPATCIVGNRNCEIYYINNIMLGEEIILDACIFDYYNQSSSNAVQFTVTGEDDPNYQVDGVHDISISCGSDAFQGVSITGNKSVPIVFHNYTLTIAFHIGPTSEENSFSIKLIVVLSPCHPGFQYDKKSKRCACFDDSDTVFCSGTTSIIKRGYWFGSVNG